MTVLSLLLSAVATAAPAGGELEWFSGPLDEAVANARGAGTHVVVYFWRNGSDHCAQLYQETLLDERTPEALGDMLLVSADYDQAAGGELFARYDVSTLPTLLFLDGEGRADDAIQGFIEAGELVGELARIRRGEGTLSGLQKAAAACTKGSDEAIETLWKLAGKHQDLGDQESHDAVLATLRSEHDPEGRTVIGARAHLWKITGELSARLAECAGGECTEECGEDCEHAEAAKAAVAQLDLSPLYEHTERVKQPEARFDGWSAIANWEARREQPDEAVAAFEQAAKVVPEEQAISFAKNVAWWAIEAEEPTAKQKKLALKMAQLAVKRAEALDPESAGYEDAYGEYEPKVVRGEALTTLAFAYDLTGNGRKAKKAAEEVVALFGDEAREKLAAILER